MKNHDALKRCLKDSITSALDDLFVDLGVLPFEGELRQELILRSPAITKCLTEAIMRSLAANAEVELSGITLEDVLKAASDLTAELEFQNQPPIKL